MAEILIRTPVHMTGIETRNLVDFLYEAGLQKKVKRTGWWVAGVDNPEDIAEHSFRTSILGYILASLDGADAAKVASMCILHDVPECRFNDGHKIAARYLDLRAAEKMAFNHQMQLLPKRVSDEFKLLFEEFEDGASKEAIIAKDADYLECAFQAKEYYDIGYRSTEDWIKNIAKKLRSKYAKILFNAMRRRHSKEWYIALNMKSPDITSRLSHAVKMCDFIFELGVLKNVKRTGFWVSGVKDPESVADHVQRAALITLILALLQGEDAKSAQNAAVMTLIHDIHEARLSDSHRIASSYLDSVDAKLIAFNHQQALLPDSVSVGIVSLYRDYLERDRQKNDNIAIIAKDADMLEYAIQAREYIDLGYKSLSSWISIYEKALKTAQAKKILQVVKRRNSKTWFPSLKTVDLVSQK